MADFTRSIVVIGARGKRFKLVDEYEADQTRVDSDGDLNQAVRRSEIEVLS